MELGVSHARMTQTVRVHEGDVLLAVDEQPENEVGVKPAILEEAYASPWLWFRKR